MLPAESGITYALGLLGGRRTVDGGPEKASCKAALRPLMHFSALRPGMFFAGIASADVFRRLASSFNGNWPAQQNGF
mgnify:FL=1